jgi:hypothetical protein
MDYLRSAFDPFDFNGGGVKSNGQKNNYFEWSSRIFSASAMAVTFSA